MLPCLPLSPSVSYNPLLKQGYEDQPDDDDDNDNDDDNDGTYADEEYGAKKKPAKKKKQRMPSATVARPRGWSSPSFVSASSPRLLRILASTRQISSSDSDSEYGSRAHKRKKKHRQSTEEIRVSSRGGRIPNYVDDVQDFEKFDEDEPAAAGYVADHGIQFQEEDEIEAVLSHSRDEGHENDSQDLWFENIVGFEHIVRLELS
jgi:chromodomain-helicase-DNA-binding protein 1